MRPALGIFLAGCGGLVITDGMLDASSDHTTGAPDVAADVASDGGRDVSQEPDAPITTRCPVSGGLLAYFPLDEDTKDHSGNGYDAYASGVTPVTGVVNGAMHFDGTTSTMHVADGAATLAGPRTLCAWVRPAAKVGLGQPLLWGGADGTGDFFSVSASSPMGGTCAPFPPNTPFVDHWGTQCFHAASLSVPAASWSFTCVAFDGGGLSFSVNGSVASGSGTFYDYALTTVYIGSTNAVGTTTNRVLDGDLDEVSIWARALSPAEVASMWNLGEGCQLN